MISYTLPLKYVNQSFHILYIDLPVLITPKVLNILYDPKSIQFTHKIDCSVERSCIIVLEKSELVPYCISPRMKNKHSFIWKIIRNLGAKEALVAQSHRFIFLVCITSCIQHRKDIGMKRHDTIFHDKNTGKITFPYLITRFNILWKNHLDLDHVVFSIIVVALGLIYHVGVKRYSFLRQTPRGKNDTNKKERHRFLSHSNKKRIFLMLT